MSSKDKEAADPREYEELLDNPERIHEILRQRQEKEKEQYDVGYRRPPKASQFKPGQSGNPRGRPKRSLDPCARFERIVTDTVEVRIANRTCKIPRLEAVFMTILNKALKGDLKASMFIYKAVKELGLFKPRPQQLIVDDLNRLTPEELDKLEELLSKVGGKMVPM
jgi:hypothetical protein